MANPKRDNRESWDNHAGHPSTVRQIAEADALFQSIGEGTIVTDSQGNISRINQIALDILGLKREDIEGKWYPDVIKIETEDGHAISNIGRPITQVFLTGKPIFAKLYYRRGDGSRVGLALTVSPVLVNDVPIGAIEVFRDITEELLLDRAKEEFVSLVSHQLRTPATGVKQYAAMLLEGYAGELNDMQESMVRTIYESNERQIATVNDLLKVAQVDAGQVKLVRRRVALAPLLHDIVSEQMSKFVGRSQKVNLSYPKDTVWGRIDAPRMRMALENIIDNASKYTPEGKDVYVSLKRNAAGKAVISVRDEGIGIAPKDIDKIFDKFARVNSPYAAKVGGTGLGLYWTRKIVQLHGARLTIKSRLGKGTTFTITLPAVKKRAKRNP